MTVASSTSKSGPYAGNGATTVFAFNFKVQQAADVKVVRTVTTTDTQVDTTLSSGADYNVSLNGDQSASPGGNITMTSAPAVGQQITVLRNLTATQGTSIPNQGGFYPKVMENALDKLTMLVQQLSEESARSLKLSVADSITNLQDLLLRLNTAVAEAEASAGSADTDAATASAAAGSATGNAALSGQWASLLNALVAATDYSAKEWAIGTTAASAKRWAAYMGGAVEGTDYSAKYYAAQAATSAASISGGPVTSVNGMTGVVVGLASLVGVETLTNKTLQDSTTAIADDADATKKAKFQASAISTGTTRTYTFPNYDGIMAASAKGANIASASTVDLDSASGDLLHITGTTTINTMTLASGAERDIVFDGSLTWTNSANMLLPSGANITTAVGDRATVRGEGGGVTRCMHFTKADGTSLVAATTGLTLISTASAVGVSAVTFTNLDDTYDEYLVEILDVSHVSGDTFRVQTSTNNGTSFNTSGYEYAVNSRNSANSTDSAVSTSDSSLCLSSGSSVAFNATFSFMRPASASGRVPLFHWRGLSVTGSGIFYALHGAGRTNNTTAINAIRFYFLNGSIATGKFKLYGLKK